MNRLIKHSKKRLFILGIAALSLWISLCCFANPVFAQPTVPVLVDFFDTGTFGSLFPEDITYISTTKDFAIVDSSEDKVFIVNRSGVKLSEFSTVGFGSSYSSGIAFIPSTENFAIVDDSADEVFIVNSSGVLQGHFDTTAFGSSFPQGITYIPATGNFAIIDHVADEVFIVNSSGALQGQFDTEVFGSLSPKGITYIPATGNFAIVDDSADEVYIVNSSGTLLDHFDIYSVASYAQGIAFDSHTGNLYIVDQSADEVFAFNTEGHVLTQFSTISFGSTSPVGITHISGTNNFAIVDDADDDIFIVNSAGVLQSQCDISVFSNYSSGIAYIPPTVNNVIVGPPLNADLSGGGFAIVDTSRKLFITDTNCTLLDQFDTGTFGINSTYPSGITYLSTNEFMITDSSRDASFIFNTYYPGKLQGQFSLELLGDTLPCGITLIPSTGNFATVAYTITEVLIVNFEGVLQARFDTAPFSLHPQGIAFDDDNNVFAIVDNVDDEVTLLDLPCLTRSVESETVSVGVPIGPPQTVNAHDKNIHTKKNK